MYSTVAFASILQMQAAFKLIAQLQFTACLWPEQAVVNNADVYDFIIVGAGTAGSVVANRLTENPDNNVLLIEAGGDPPWESDLSAALLYLQRSRFDWNYTTEDDHTFGQCHQTNNFETTSGKMLGGTSSLNYFAYSRGYPIDYDSWAEVTNNSIWKWRNVLPYFIKSEKLEVPDILNSPDGEFHGTDGYLRVTKENSIDLSNYLNSYKEVGHDIVSDFNANRPLGYAPYLVMIANGQRQSSATAYLTPVKDRPNLHVLKNTFVQKVTFEGNKASGVEALTSDGKTITIKARKEVIISAGVFNSPKLLMLSGIGPKEHLASHGIEVIADLPVGENLQDHLCTITIHNMHKIHKPHIPFDPHVFPTSVFGGYIALNKSQPHPDYSTSNFIAGEDIILNFCSFAYRFHHVICDKIYKSIENRMAIYNQIRVLAPKSRGRVQLRSSNPADPPIIYSGQLSHDEDLENIAKYIKDINLVLNSKYFRSINAELVDPASQMCKEFLPDSIEYWRCYAKCMSSGMKHFTSTCAMGTVLDGKLKVLGVEGLRVVDASVMPQIVRGHPVAAIMMIGEKAADLIREEHQFNHFHDKKIDFC